MSDPSPSGSHWWDTFALLVAPSLVAAVSELLRRYLPERNRRKHHHHHHHDDDDEEEDGRWPSMTLAGLMWPAN